MNTIFFGSGKYVIPIIEVLKNNFDLKLIVTTEKNNFDPVVKYARENKIEYFSTHKLDENIKSKIINLNSPLAVLASFGIIIPQDFLDIFPKGIINIHPSLLPKYRGTTPVQSAILNGDLITGVSVMLLDSDMDHGPILGQKEETVLETDTAETLYTRLFGIGSQMLLDLIPRYLGNSLIPTPQNHGLATYTQPLTRESGFINLNEKLPNQSENDNLKFKIARMARAYYPWPGVWTQIRIKNKEFRIKFLPENKIQLEGKKMMTYRDFVNGYTWGKELIQKLGI